MSRQRLHTQRKFILLVAALEVSSIFIAWIGISIFGKITEALAKKNINNYNQN